MRVAHIGAHRARGADKRRKLVAAQQLQLNVVVAAVVRRDVDTGVVIQELALEPDLERPQRLRIELLHLRHEIRPRIDATALVAGGDLRIGHEAFSPLVVEHSPIVESVSLVRARDVHQRGERWIGKQVQAESIEGEGLQVTGVAAGHCHVELVGGMQHDVREAGRRARVHRIVEQEVQIEPPPPGANPPGRSMRPEDSPLAL